MSTNEEMQLIEAVREFAENNLNDPEYLEKFSPEMWEKIADFGLLASCCWPIPMQENGR